MPGPFPTDRNGLAIGGPLNFFSAPPDGSSENSRATNPVTRKFKARASKWCESARTLHYGASLVLDESEKIFDEEHAKHSGTVSWLVYAFMAAELAVSSS